MGIAHRLQFGNECTKNTKGAKGAKDTKGAKGTKKAFVFLCVLRGYIE